MKPTHDLFRGPEQADDRAGWFDFVELAIDLGGEALELLIEVLSGLN
jgi:hypothetical protein